MTMFYFSYTMALFWIFAELFIIMYIQKGVSFITQDGKKHHGFPVVAGIFFILLIFATFFRQHLYPLLPDIPDGMRQRFYNYTLWHFYCSQWVVFEAVITLYILRVYARVLQAAFRSNKRMLQRWNSIERVAVIGIPVFPVIYAFMFAGYEFLTFSALQDALIDGKQLHHIYLFYIKICGVFWIIIDAGAAFIGFKILRFLKIRSPFQAPYGLAGG